jgi:hypothetical protein
MNWSQTPRVKIYEALGAVADGRVHVVGNTAKVYSSSGNKFYTVSYDPALHAIMVNDNGSFYKGYLGYPAVAFLMQIGELPYSEAVAQKLKGVAWKDINQKFKNDFEKAIDFILSSLSEGKRAAIEAEVTRIDELLKLKTYVHLGSKVRPPEGY